MEPNYNHCVPRPVLQGGSTFVVHSTSYLKDSSFEFRLWVSTAVGAVSRLLGRSESSLSENRLGLCNYVVVCIYV